ncbi:hypothetical protein ACFQVC_14430 [Streptomyces monticola]|uniref:DUF4232 domain-containing protein n=1 Tax=Streptomyces monticola TaxID=2666263 RepID=A0ABW2JIC6_9ACTN
MGGAIVDSEIRATGTGHTARAARARGRRRGALLGLVTLVSALLFALAAPCTAHAAASSCAGNKVRTLKFSTGKVVIYRGTGFVCAMTYAKNPGAARKMSITLQARGHRAVTRAGTFRKYAGPLSVTVSHRRVKVSGKVGSGSLSPRWIRY